MKLGVAVLVIVLGLVFVTSAGTGNAAALFQVVTGKALFSKKATPPATDWGPGSSGPPAGGGGTWDYPQTAPVTPHTGTAGPNKPIPASSTTNNPSGLVSV